MLGLRGLKSVFDDQDSQKSIDLNVSTSTTSTSHYQKSFSMPPSAQSENPDVVVSRTKELGDGRQLNGNGSTTTNTRKVTSLRDATQRSITLYRTELGSSSEEFLSSCQTIDLFFDYVAGIRLRQMPHHSSRWDKVLKWAEFFASQIYWYSEEVSQFADYSTQAAQIIWASCRSLLELGPRYVPVMEKAFGIFYSCGLTLGFFLRHHELLHSSEELQFILAASFTDLLRLVTGVNLYYSRKQLNVTFSASGFDELFGQSIGSFFAHSDQFTDAVWASRLESLAKPGDLSVDLVRELLTPHDTVTRMLAVARHIKKSRADFTCEWFDRHLADFTRNGKELLFVTGNPSTGKSVLSEWVVERLQSITGRRATEVLTYAINPDLKTELTGLSVVKGLLLQLIQLNVGDNGLYKSLAVAYDLSIQGHPTSEVEDALWRALEGGLRGDHNQTIVVDGLDQLQGGEVASLKLLERLHSISLKHTKTKVIVFSQPIAKASPKYAHFSIEAEHTRQDMLYFTETLLSAQPAFEILSQTDRSTVTTTLVNSAAGSYTCLIQAVEILKGEKSSESILKKAKTVPKTLSEILDLNLGTLDLKHKDTRSIFAWLLTAERPLLIREIKQLLEIDTSNCTMSARSTRVEDDVLQSCGPLIDIRDGFVRFRHHSIKQNILQRAASVADFKNAGPFPFHIKEAHYDMTIRCLAYVKITLTRPSSPTLEPLNNYELDELFRSYEFLQYSSRYWSLHFQSSPMHEPTVAHKITSGFKMCFPDTTLLSLIEGSCFPYQFSPTQTIDLYLLTLSLRRMVLGEVSEPVLQTVLNLLRTKQVLLKPGEINDYYYVAWKLSTTLKLTSIAKTCAHRYVETTSKITISKNTDVTSHRIELLRYIITIQRESKVTNQELIVYIEMLATIYTTIGEIELASQFYREVYELNVRIHGRSSKQAIRSYENFSSTVKKSSKTEDINEITRTSYEDALHTLSVTDSTRLSLTWSMINSYEKQKDFFRLEEVIVYLWRSLSSLTNTKDTSVQETKIDVALRYVEFLKQQKRSVEAENILRGLWVELDNQGDDSTIVISRGEKIGHQLQSLGSVAVARSVFSRLWAYYVKIGKQSSSEATSVYTSLTQTTQAVGSDASYEITDVREIFESTITSSTTTTITTMTVTTATTLIETYYQRQEWQEVIKVGRLTIIKLWPAFDSKDMNTPLPSSYTTEVIEMASRLAFSYFKLHQLESVENVYRRIFYAVRVTPKSSDELLLSTSKNLIEFYETHSMLQKTIVVYKDLYEETQKRHGKTSTLSIKTLYTLGDLSLRVNDTSNAEFAYYTIHTNLSQGTDVCHRDAIKAALALATLYEQSRQYSSAQKIYHSLWQMFIKHGKDYDMKADFAENLYQKYVRILKQAAKPDYQTLRQLAIVYRKACVQFYGVSHETTLKATLRLAEISEEKEEHREDAVAMYEEADQKSRDVPKGQVSESLLSSIVAARRRLPYLYSTTKLSTSPRAITLYTEEHQSSLSKNGHAHRDSLTWLSLLAIAYAKQGNSDSTHKGIHGLQTSAFEILRNEKNSQRLADSGSSLANIYLKAGLKSDAEKLLVQLRSQAVFGQSEQSKSLGLANNTKLDPRTWAFIVAFVVTLRGQKHQYSSIMADLINEVFMYESYHRSISQKSSFLVTLVHGARLLQFTKDIQDSAGTSLVEKEVLDYFSTGLSASKSTNSAVLREFFNLVLVEINKVDADVAVMKTSIYTVDGYMNGSKFQDAYDLAFLVDQFQQFKGGYNNLVKIDLGLKLALTLAGRGKPKCQDAKLRASLLELSSTIMRQIIKTVRTMQFNILEIPIEVLNTACGLLGEQQNLDDLEWILTELWNARHSQQSWSSSVVVHIGRRLVETQFARGNHEKAIHLCEDMCYNLRRVWGALDVTTLEMHELLSSFYTTVGNYRKAMLVHEDVLRDTVSDKGDELPSAEASAIAVRQLELLKRAYQRLGSWDKEPQVYVDLYQQLAHVFGSEENWKKAQTQSVEKWQAKGADQVGVWTRPETFEFILTKPRKHANWLRKSSGSWSLGGHFHGKRLSRTYSAQSIST